MTPPSPQREKHFRFLRTLRANGRTNMYGAVPYLMRTFALDRDQAFSIVCEWLDQQEEAISLQPPTPTTRRKTSRRHAA